jgi:hypothetical protein
MDPLNVYAGDIRFEYWPEYADFFLFIYQYTDLFNDDYYIENIVKNKAIPLTGRGDT